MDPSEDISSMSSDLSSQQELVNQLKDKLRKNESLLKGRENDYHELQSKFNKLRFLAKSKTSSAVAVSAESTPTRTPPAEDRMTSSTSSETSAGLDSANRGKFLLLKKQLEESRSLIHQQESENQSMKRELQELRDKLIKYEAERDDREVEVITTTESTGDQRIDDMFAQIVYKDTKIMEMNQKTNDLEAKIMDLQENLKEQNEVLQARNRAIKVLLAQQQEGSPSMALSFDEVVQREEERERIEKLKERVAELEMEKGSLQLRVMELEGTNGSKPPLIDIELERDQLSAERDELRVKTNELVAKLDSLELQNDRVVSERDKVANELKKLKDVNNGLTREKDKQKSEIDRLTQTIAGIQSNYSLVNNELNALKATIDDKDREIQSVRQQLSDLALKSKHMIADKDLTIAELTEQLSLKSDDSTAKEKDELIEKLTKKLETAKNENWGLVNINEELKQQCSQYEDRLVRTEAECGVQKTALERLLAEKESIEAEKRQLSDEFSRDIEILNEENTQLKARLETSSAQLTEYEQKFLEFSSSADSETKHLLNVIESLKTTNSELEFSFNEKVVQLEDKIKTLTEELSTLSGDKNNVSDQLTSLRQELEEERQQKAIVIKNFEELQSSANNDSENVVHLENQIKRLTEELSVLSEDKNNISEQLDRLIHELDNERQLKSSALKELEALQSSVGNDSEVIRQKDSTISELQDELKKCQNIIKKHQDQLEDIEKDKEESTTFIRELETDLELKIRALDELQTAFDEKQNLLKEKSILVDEMYEQKQDLELRFEEAKVKNQTLANQMENLIKIVEIESQEKERLKQSLESLQKENFNESDLIREKDLRIESLQKEIRKQVEDMQEVEELLSEKTAEIESLTADVERVGNEKSELVIQNEELIQKLNNFSQDSSEELTALKREIEDLNEENDWNKNEIKLLNDKLTDEMRDKERLVTREEENRLTIGELRKQLESQEMKLTEAMNELMQKSDVNTETNLLLNEVQTLRQSVDSLETANRTLQTDHQKSISQLDAAVNEYKALLDESRHQIDRLESEKLSAVQETNKVNQVLETERQTQSLISDQNEQLRQQIANMESELESVRASNQLESESLQSERINQLNETIDDLRKENSELGSQLDQLRQLREELQSSSAQQLEELQIRSQTERTQLEQRLNDLQTTVDGIAVDKEQSDNSCFEFQKKIQELHILLQEKDIEIANLKRLEESHQKCNNDNQGLNQKLAELQATVQMVSEEKSRFEFAYNDLVHRYQELNHLVQTKSYEIESLKQLESSCKKLNDSLNNLKEEKSHLLTVVNEKQESIDRQNKEKEKLFEEKLDIERSLRESERNISLLEDRIQELTQTSGDQSKRETSAVMAEDGLHSRVQELEHQLQESQQLSNETESKLAEVEYELDILKKNYNLEMESLGAQVQERETMADKLQERNEKYKRKCDRLEKQMKELTEKEAYYKSKIEESEGIIKYEQMQRQSVTDSRIFELQQQVKDLENSHQIEAMNLRSDISNMRVTEDQLRQRIKELEQTGSAGAATAAVPLRQESDREIANYRKQVESMAAQLEAERHERGRIQELYQSGGQSGDQISQLLAQMETERQQQIAQRQELELKCKKFAAKFKVKEREVNALEEKLRIAKDNASKNVNEEDLIDSNKRIEELTKKVDDLQFTASNLDSALQIERQKRRELENEKQTFWSQSSRATDTAEAADRQSSSSFSLLIDGDGNGDKSGLGSAKRFFSKQKHYLLRGPPNAKYKRLLIGLYLAVIHILFIKACLF